MADLEEVKKKIFLLIQELSEKYASNLESFQSQEDMICINLNKKKTH
jgi:hypothetical protein